MRETIPTKRIFITGGTGLIGKWLLFLLQKLDVEVVVLSRNPSSFIGKFPLFGQSPKITFIKGDIRDFSFPSDHFNYVIHAATEASVKLDQENPGEMYSVIVDGTKRVLEFSRQAGVQRLLYISSGAVYGIQPPELSHIPETFPCNPVTAYGKGKLKAEQMCLESSIETIIARCFAFVGPYLPLATHFAIGNFIRNCLHNEPIMITGDGTPLRSYMYATDLAEWLWTILLRGKNGKAYNVGSDEAISITDLAHLVRDCAGTKNEIIIREKAIAETLPSRYVPSISRAKTDLDLTVRHSLTDSIQRTIAFAATGQ